MEIQNVKFWIGDMEVEEAAIQQIMNISGLPITNQLKLEIL